MKEYTATELAYKNGYEAGVKEFAERLKDSFGYGWLLGSGVKTRTDTIAKELSVNYESSKNDKQRKEDEGK